MLALVQTVAVDLMAEYWLTAIASIIGFAAAGWAARPHLRPKEGQNNAPKA